MDSGPPSPSYPMLGEFSLSPEQLSDSEKRWAGYQPYLLSKGYQLRPRYQPNWVPSWTLNNQDPALCEDAWEALDYRTLDAVRIEDQKLVVIKMIMPSTTSREGLHELEIIKRFSGEDFANDKTNHVVPCLDTFNIPDVEGGIFYVMPLLTDYNDPNFECLGEVYDFLCQIFEGLVFLHQHDVAHCDIASPNILMDARPIYLEQFHPLHPGFSYDGTHLVQTRSRTEAPVRYYYIDFGYSVWNRDGTANLVTGRQAREPVPEQVKGEPYNPFVADVYQLGALIRRDLIPAIPSLRFMLPLARAMTENDPRKRIKLLQAQQGMHSAFAAQGARRLRWPIIPKNVGFVRWMALTAYGIQNEVIIFMQTIARLCHRLRLAILGS